MKVVKYLFDCKCISRTTDLYKTSVETEISNLQFEVGT